MPEVMFRPFPFQAGSGSSSLLDVARKEESHCAPVFRDWGAKKLKKAVTPADETDAILAKELTQLSMSEREEVLADLHGVADVVDEVPEMVEKAFADLEVEINKIKKRGPYEKALFLDPEYVQNRDFRIKFLRADRFDAKQAAQRMVNHFDYKLELFGYERLARDITFEDLREEDRQDLLQGGYWALKNHDRAGRRILLATLEQIFSLNSSHCEVLWYVYMNALEDPRTQKNGIVDLVYCIRGEKAQGYMQKPAFNVEHIVKSARLPSALPFRLVGVHVCYEATHVPAFLSIFQMAMEMKYRMRFRMHQGSPLEIQYELGSYGIPMQIVPLDTDGRLNLATYLECVKERIDLETERKQAQLETGRIVHPSPFDVLLGRGRPYQEYPGNIHLAQLVERHQEAYEKGERCDKAVLAKHVIHQIRELGGKFLRRPEEEGFVGWEEVDDETTKVKVGNTFRTKRKLEKRKEQGTKRKGN